MTEQRKPSPSSSSVTISTHDRSALSAASVEGEDTLETGR